MNIKEEIYKFFEIKADISGKSSIAQSDENYLENGIIDSMRLIEMIVIFEDKFKIKFSTENLQSKEFRTISGLIDLVTNLQNKNKK